MECSLDFALLLTRLYIDKMYTIFSMLLAKRTICPFYFIKYNELSQTIKHKFNALEAVVT